MKKSKKFFAVFALVLSMSAFSAPIRHIIIFGDSLSDAGENTPAEDVGNNFWAVAQGKTGAPIVNMDTRTQTHPLWVNWFSELQHPRDTLHPWRLLNDKELDPAVHSVNYAFASAETGDHWLNDISGEKYPPYVDAICHAPGKIGPKTACVPGVLKQVQLYLNAVHHPDPDTVFIVWAGGNDMLNNITKAFQLFSQQGIKDIAGKLLNQFENLTAHTQKKNLSPAAPDFSDPLINLLAAKDRLIEAGVKPEQIYILNLPDLSKSPACILLSKGNPAILSAIHALSVAFNDGLSLTLSHNYFSDNNLPESNILSVYDLLNEIIDNPEKYGMTHLSQNCVLDGQTPECKGYVFFNDKHPTAETGKIFARWAVEKIHP